jgi:hypothetical protein
LIWHQPENRPPQAEDLSQCSKPTIGGINQTGFKHKMVDFKEWNPCSDSLLEMPASQPLSLTYIWSSVKAMVGRDSADFSKDLLASDPEAFTEAKRICYGEDLWIKIHPLILYWAGIVDIYSIAKMTRTGDRLIAIAGLVKILSQRTGIRYVAGHWLYQLPRQLLWSSEDMEPTTHGDKYIPPSWSWGVTSNWLNLEHETSSHVGGARSNGSHQDIGG